MILSTPSSRRVVFAVLHLLLAGPLFAQAPVWAADHVFQNNAFLVNAGQCHYDKAADSIAYTVDNGFDQFAISATRLYAKVGHVELEKEKIAKLNRDHEEKEQVISNSILEMHWLNANEEMKYDATEKRDDYFTYVLWNDARDEGKGVQVNGYRKLAGRELYPGIDIEYSFLEGKGGIKYTLYVHPGADISKLEFLCEGDVKKLSLLDDGTLHASLPEGEFLDQHAPAAWIDGSGKSVKCNYRIDGKKVQFVFPEGYDNTQTLVIDPWVVNSLPSMTTVTNGFDVDYDNFGSLYIYGGLNPFKVCKYSNTGALLWTFNGVVASIGWNSNTIGACSNFAVNRANGKVYVGHTPMIGNARVIRLTTAGVYNNFVTSLPATQYTEIWDMAIDCSNSSILCFGGSPSGSNSVGRIDTATAAMLPTNVTGFTQTNQDVVSGLIDKNGTAFLYLVTGFTPTMNNKILRLNATLNGNTWNTASGYTNFTELPVSNKQYYVGNPVWMSNGFNCLAANTTYVFYYDGLNLKAFNKTTGAAVGIALAIPGHLVMRQGGITADDCNNVYIGGMGEVKGYNFNGNTFNSIGNVSLGAALSTAHVYDVRYQPLTNSLYVAGQNFAGNFAPLATGNCNPLTSTTTGSCSGSATATITSTFTNPSVIYNWYNSVGTLISTTTTPNLSNTVTGLTIGTYIVVMQVSAGCDVFMTSDTITIGNNLQANANPVVPVTCFGGSNGSATAVPVIPGSYNFSWNTSPVQSSATASGLPAGNYVCTITDPANGCTTTLNVTITQPPQLAAIPMHANVTCNGAGNGSASVTVSGGTGSYTYTWNTSPVQSSPGVINLQPGNYTCSITDSLGCSIAQSFSITQPAVLALTGASSNVSCSGGGNGSASVTATGGNGAYSYSWNTTPPQLTSTATGLSGGTYVCTVTDSLGCTTAASVTIFQPAPLATSFTATNVSCNGGTNGAATVSVIGGAGIIQYSWNTSPAQSTATASGLAAGNYNCTVTDSLGCTATQNVIITEPAVLSVSGAVTNEICWGGNTGDATASPFGGTGPYSFLWSTTPAQSTNTISNLTAGNYSCAVTDSLGCTATLNVSITEPPAMSVTSAVTNVTCANGTNGTASVNPSGGASPYSYSWNTTPAQTTSTAGNLGAGTYLCVITDSLGCSVSQQVTISQPAAMSMTANKNDALCFGQNNGSIAVNVTGGTGAYTYQWSPLSAGNAATANSLYAGNYTCTATDSLGCTVTMNFTIVQPQPLVVTAGVAQTICAGAGATLSAQGQGGTGAYSYTWSPNGPNVSPATSTTYTVIISDGNNCTDTTTQLITVSPLPVVNFTGDTLAGCVPLCVNFSDLSTATLPDTLSNWSWDFGDGNTGTTATPSHCYATPGVYSVSLIVSNNNGCVSSLTLPNLVNVYSLPQPAFTSSPQPTSILNPLVNFTDQSIDAVQWQWYFSQSDVTGSTLQDPQYLYTDTGCFHVQLQVTSIHGCVADTSGEVCIDPDYSLFVPNTFTPNGDGKNDLFFPVGTGITDVDYKFMIFDRWGNLIWQSTQWGAGWDGRANNGSEIAQIDSYVYRIGYRDIVGDYHTVTGHVNLIR